MQDNAILDRAAQKLSEILNIPVQKADLKFFETKHKFNALTPDAWVDFKYKGLKMFYFETGAQIGIYCLRRKIVYDILEKEGQVKEFTKDNLQHTLTNLIIEFCFVVTILVAILEQSLKIFSDIRFEILAGLVLLSKAFQMILGAPGIQRTPYAPAPYGVMPAPLHRT